MKEPLESTLRFVDLSLPLAASASERVPVCVEFLDHREGARQMSEIFGVPAASLPGGSGWAAERLTAVTHAGTHMDAPWHYGPISEGRRARTIDEVPLEWCHGPGMVLDLRHKQDGEEIAICDLEKAADRIGRQPEAGDIVLLHTGADRFWGLPDYPERGCGLGRGAIHWLLSRGVRVVGTDAWGLDRPFAAQRAEYERTGDPEVLWPVHFAGREREYCQLEKLTGLDRLPPCGFTVICFPIKIPGASAAWARVVALLGVGEPRREG